MKIIDNWRKNWKIKYKAKTRKEYRQKYEKKYLEKTSQIEKDKEIFAQAKIKEIENLHDHYKIEIDQVRIRTENYWKNLLNERDERINSLENDNFKRRESIIKFAQMIQDFETNFTTTKIEVEAAGEYVKKAEQKLLTGSGSWEIFFSKYRKDFPRIQEKLKEE